MKIKLTKKQINKINNKSVIWAKKQIECSWEGAFKFAEKLNKEKHLGRTNWRVPKLWELMRVRECGGKGFEDAFYWSSTTLVSYTSYAWEVSFSNGYVLTDNKIDKRHVRCISNSKENKGI